MATARAGAAVMFPLRVLGAALLVSSISAARGLALLGGPSLTSSPHPRPPDDPNLPGTVDAALLTWQPHQDKYLVMLCTGNKMSSLMRCIHNHVLLAGILNRTLLVPDRMPLSDRNLVRQKAWQRPKNLTRKVLDLRVMWDLEHSTECLGEGRVERIGELERRERKKVVADVIHCWQGLEEDCGGSLNNNRRARASCPAAVSLSTVSGLIPDPSAFEAYLPQIDLDVLRSHTVASASCLPHDAEVTSVLQEFTTGNKHVRNARVLIIGDLSSMRLLDPRKKGSDYEWGKDPFTRTAQCSNRLLLQPAQELVHNARSVVQTLFVGQPYLALHWARGEYLQFCERTPAMAGKCAYAAPQAATCVAETLRRTNISRVYLATNAAAAEVIVFKRYLLHVSKLDVHVYSAPPLDEKAPWVQALKTKGVAVQQERGSLRSTLDKMMCAISHEFVGSAESVFTSDVQRLRTGLGVKSTTNTYLCMGKAEWDSSKNLEETLKTNLRFL